MNVSAGERTQLCTVNDEMCTKPEEAGRNQLRCALERGMSARPYRYEREVCSADSPQSFARAILRSQSSQNNILGGKMEKVCSASGSSEKVEDIAPQSPSWFPTEHVKRLRLVGDHSHTGKVVSLNKMSRSVESLPTNKHAETARALVRIMEQVSTLSLHGPTHIQTRRTKEVLPLSSVSMPRETFTCAAQMAR